MHMQCRHWCWCMCIPPCMHALHIIPWYLCAACYTFTLMLVCCMHTLMLVCRMLYIHWCCLCAACTAYIHVPRIHTLMLVCCMHCIIIHLYMLIYAWPHAIHTLMLVCRMHCIYIPWCLYAACTACRQSVCVLSASEVNQYGIGDVVLPCVGTSSTMPANKVGVRLTEILATLGVSLASFRCVCVE